MIEKGKKEEEEKKSDSEIKLESREGGICSENKVAVVYIRHCNLVFYVFPGNHSDQHNINMVIECGGSGGNAGRTRPLHGLRADQ